jgi:hypothetical protein
MFIVFGSSSLAIDDNSHFTNIGDIALTVTNYGVFGTGFFITGQPSCEYPIGSHIEHLWYGGLWFGGIQNGETKVSTGAIDRNPGTAGTTEGYEFTSSADPQDKIVEKSSLVNSPYYDPNAISHQDFVCDYTDSNTHVPESGDSIVNHTPLKIVVHQETYAWSMAFADAFVILRFDITNKSHNPADSIYDIYTGFWYEPTIGNTDLTPTSGPNRSWNWYDDACNFIDSTAMGYKFDYDGDNGFAESYAAMRFLGSTPASYRDEEGNRHLYTDSGVVKYNIWKWNNRSDPVFSAPQYDPDRYSKLSNGLNDYPDWRNTIDSVLARANWTMLISSGPYRTLYPESTMQVVFAMVCANKYGVDQTSDDTPLSKLNLMKFANWAKTAYDGEDKNGDGILQPSEDINHNGILDRYQLPVPPPSPNMKLVASDSKVEIYWDTSPELFIDPVLGRQDFEGYRIYRARVTQDNQNRGLRELLEMIGEFDKIDSIGYNTGLGYVTLPADTVFPGDTVHYHYKFTCDKLLNSWQYIFAVTAFDTGDPVNNLESLESSPLVNYQRAIPGTPAQGSGKVGVFPNPYRAYAIWDGRGTDGVKERLRKIYFYNLPQKCQITIYTVAGEVVDRIEHDAATYSGADIAWYQNYASGDVVFPGGVHSWDVVSSADQAIATGLYLYTVKDDDSGNIQKGKFLIVK